MLLHSRQPVARYACRLRAEHKGPARRVPKTKKCRRDTVWIKTNLSPARIRTEPGLPFKEPPPAAVEAAKKAPTPHLSDGHPDLTGFWAPAGWGYAVTQGKVSADGKTDFTQRQEDGPNQTPEKAAELKRRMEGANLPPYKPEFVAKVKGSGGAPKQEGPSILLRAQRIPARRPADGDRAESEDPRLPLRHRELFRAKRVSRGLHRWPRADPTLNPSYYGDSIGHWEGNTMVVDVTNFVDDTWLSQNGTIHSDAMHVVEKLTREGNVINWEISH